MPALQVRDFPATLYDELKEYAARNHRSIAQQTIIAVEEMLAEASACLLYTSPRASAPEWHRAGGARDGGGG